MPDATGEYARLPRVMELHFDARFEALQAVDKALHDRGVGVTIRDCDEAVHAFIEAYNKALPTALSGGDVTP